MRIHRLDSLTIDQIAAGEVIDVPASCMKELVENSLDAQSTEIVVEVSLGGRELIRVTDNGIGMNREDLIASIERHSTSKLRTIDDLERLVSRGFRGEALASIVAVAQVTITSAERGSSSAVGPATTLVVEGGKILSVSDATALSGTSVEVRSLFFNVPARRKFLKSPAKDTSDIVKTMTKLALAAPTVSFRLIVDGETMVSVRAEDGLSRIRSLLAEPFAQETYEVCIKKEGMALTGLIAHPRHARGTRAGQYLIVNGRPVHSLPISYGVKGAFGTTCEDNKHPQFALHLTIDPSAIDVNVHPQKREVRFADDEGVKRLVQEGVSEALFGESAFTGLSTFACSSAQRYEPEWRQLEMEESPSLIPITEAETVSSSPVCVAVMGDIALFQHGRVGLFLLDLRQAMRSVIVRELNASLGEKTIQALLVPVPLECSAQEACILTAHLPELEKLGIQIRSFGPQSFLIEGVPHQFSDLDLQKFILDIVHEDLFAAQKTAREERNKRVAHLYVGTMRALRSPISPQTALGVYQRWITHGSPEFAPDGQPCSTHLTVSALQELIAHGPSKH